jgi:hypothetical protein
MCSRSEVSTSTRSTSLLELGTGAQSERVHGAAANQPQSIICSDSETNDAAGL